MNLAAPETVATLAPLTDQHALAIRVEKVACKLDIVLPEGLTFVQTNQYDPTPQPKIDVREWHLEASTPQPATEMQFLLVATPWKVAEHEAVPDVRAVPKRFADRLEVEVVKSGRAIATLRFSHAAGKFPEVKTIP